MVTRWFAVALCLSSVLVVPGCGESGANSTKRNAQSDAAPAVADADRHAGADGADPTSAVSAVTAVLQGLNEKHPRALWEFLPPGYRTDVNNLIHHLARTADPVIWRRTFTVLAKLADVLKKQRALLKEAAGDERNSAFDASLAWLQSAEVLDVIVHSDLAEPSATARLDVGDFLSDTGGKLMRRVEELSQVGAHNPFRERLSKLSRVRVHELKSASDKATLRIEVPGQPAEEVEFVRVEGHWIPRDLADGWIEHIGRANAMVSTLSAENLGPARSRLLALLDELEGLLDKLGAARDTDQFSAVLQTGLGSLQELMAPLRDAAEPESASHPAPGVQSVAIIVKGRLDENARTQLLERLGRAAFGSQSGGTAEYTAGDTTTIFRVGPVADIEEFSRSLGFIDVTSVDTAARRITAKIKE